MIIEFKKAVLVVIPTLNEARTIEGVIQSLCVDLPARMRIKFVIADGGSTDGTVQIVRKLADADPRIVFVANPNRLQSSGVNVAAHQCGGGSSVLIRCDAHADYPAGYIVRLLETLDRTGADAVVVPMDSVGTTRFQQAVAWVSNTWAGTGGSAHRGGKQSGFVDHGHHAAFRMNSFRLAGWYDESFSHNEDAELDCRQIALGSRIYLDSDIRLAYQPRASWGSLARQYFHYGRGRGRTVQRHPGSMRLRQAMVPAHFALCALALALAPTQPWPMVWPALYLLALGAVSLGVARRHRAWHGLLSGPAAAVMHSSWAAGFFWSLLSARERPWRAPGAPVREGLA